MEPASPSQPRSELISAKKLSKMIRVAFFMIRNRIRKSKLIANLHHMTSVKAIKSFMFHHHIPAVAPRDYEFSCSSTPAHHHFSSKRKKQSIYYFSPAHSAACNDEVMAVTALEKILEMLDDDQQTEMSPYLPGFGHSPSMIRVRQLRITDSPFTMMNEDQDQSVDKEAEEFIQRFYAQLKLQKKMSEL